MSPKSTQHLADQLADLIKPNEEAFIAGTNVIPVSYETMCQIVQRLDFLAKLHRLMERKEELKSPEDGAALS